MKVLLRKSQIIFRFNSYGMSEEDFAENMLCNFRATLYVGRRDTSLPGKANLRDTQHFVDRSILVDRAGGLSDVFQAVAERAKTGSSMTFDIPVDTHSRARIVVTMIMKPVAMAPLVMLSTRPTLSQMLVFNTKTLGVNHGSVALAHLMDLLTTLEKFNYVTLWTEGFPDQSRETGNLDKMSHESFAQSNVALNTRSGNVHASGLRIGNKDSQRPVKSVKQSVQNVADTAPDLSIAQQLEKRIAGLKKMGFSDETIAKMMATIPSQGVSTTPSSPTSGIVTGKAASVATPTSTPSSSSAESKKTAVDVEKRIAGLKKMGFSDETIAKMMATIPSQGVSTTPSSPTSGIVTGKAASVATPTSTPSSASAESKKTAVDVEKRIAGLKKMGFSDETIAKMMATIPSQGVSTTPSSPTRGSESRVVVVDKNERQGGLLKRNRFESEESEHSHSFDTSDDTSVVTSNAEKDDVPAVCRLPGVRGGSLCERYLDKGEDGDTEYDEELLAGAMPLLKGLSSPDSLIAEVIMKLAGKKTASIDDSDAQKQVFFPGKWKALSHTCLLMEILIS
jgi:Holliday junction resolvasome RuvABC DNA-binding subunit